MSGPRGCDSIHNCQFGQFLQTAMNIDLDESRGLARRAGSMFDADTLQLYEADYAGLRRLQLTEQVLQQNGVYRRLPTVLDRYLVVKRECRKP